MSSDSREGRAPMRVHRCASTSPASTTSPTPSNRPLAATARPRRRDDRADRAAADERPRRLAASGGDQHARHLQRPARSAGRPTRPRRRPRDPSDQRRRTNAKPYWSAYSASKAGAEHLVRSAATDLEGSACGICSLDPGITETPMQVELRSREFPDRDRFVRVYEQGSGRTPEEVADAIFELSRREPRTLNGQTFRVGEL